jgi:hypothetical protein
VPDANTASFMSPEVDHCAASSISDESHSFVQLGAAVAATGSENISSQALAVHSNKDWVAVVFVQVAHCECKVFDSVEFGPERMAFECPPLRWDLGGRYSLNELLGLASVPDKIGNGDHEKSVLVSERSKFVNPGHL